MTPQGPDTIEVRTLGAFEVRFKGASLALPSSHAARRLLVYLLLERKAAHRREELAALLWPDSTESQSRTNLRRELHRLISADALIASCISKSGDALQWQPPETTHTCLDSELFVHYIDDAEHACDDEHRLECLEQAVRVYQGEFMPRFQDEFCITRRAAFDQAFRAANERRLKILYEKGQYEKVEQAARSAIAFDPLTEWPYQIGMQAQLARGERTAALQTFNEYAAMLQTEFGIEPEGLMLELYQRIGADSAVQAGGQRTHPVASHHDGIDFVGRQGAMRWLDRHWRTTLAGGTRAVLIEGEAGIGKTRLVEEFVAAEACLEVTAIWSRAWSGGDLPFGVVSQWLNSVQCQRLRNPESEAAFKRLSTLFPVLNQHGESGSTDQVSSEPWRDRNEIFSALTAFVAGVGKPLILVLDDFQWIDTDSFEWVQYLLRLELPAPVLLVMTLRTGELADEHPVNRGLMHLAGSESLDRLSLTRLAPSETESLVRSAASRFGSNNEVNPDLLWIVNSSSGNPFLVIELVRANAMSEPDHDGSRRVSKVPTLVLDRVAILPPDSRRVLNLAAVFGRSLTGNLVRTAADLDAARIDDALDDLWRRGLISEDGGGGYEFAHDCIREAVYAALRPVRRRAMHARMADALQSMHANDLDPVAALIASHLDRAGEPALAVNWYGRAANAAESLFASRQAVAMLERALELLDAMPESQKLQQRQARILLGIAANIHSLEGFSAPAAADYCARLEQLLPAIANPVIRIQMINRIRVHCTDSLRLPRALDWAVRSAGESALLDIPIFHVEAHRALGTTRLLMGQPGLGHDSFLESHQSAQNLQNQTDARYSGTTWPIRMLYAWWPISLWLRSDFELAVQMLDESCQLPGDAASRFTMIFASQLRGLGWALLDKQNAVEREVAYQREMRKGYEYPLLLSDSILHGWTMIRGGRHRAGLKMMSESISQLESVQNYILLPIWLGILAGSSLRADQPVEAGDAAQLGLSIAARTGQHCWDAELYRLLAESVARQGGDSRQVAGHVRRAKTLANRQGATIVLTRLSESEVGNVMRST